MTRKLQGLDNVDVVIMCHAVSMFAKVKDLKEEDNGKIISVNGLANND